MNEEERQQFRQAVGEAVKILQQGGVILYPTDTVWGLGCDATCSDAVRRIFEIKQRADSKAMLTLTDAEGRVEQYFDDVPEVAWQLWEVTDKPLTLILPRAHGVASELIAEDGTMGIRITREAVSQGICQRLRKPLVSTSANISGQPTPKCFAEISQAIRQAVDYIVPLRQDEGQNPSPSGIIKLGDGGLFTVIR